MLLKERIVRLSKRSGAVSRVRDSAWRQRRLLVLGYHGVSVRDEHEWAPDLYMPPELLAARLRFLRDEGYTILPLAEALTRLYSGMLPPRSVALTFDDGYTDFWTQAVPLLREFNAPATVYLTTYYSTVRLPVFSPMLSYILWKGRDCQRAAPRIAEIDGPIDVSTADGRDRVWNALRDLVANTGMNVHEQHALAGRVAAAVGVDFDDINAAGILQIMPPEMVRLLPSDLVSVQLHTHRHRTATERLSFLRELEENASLIAALRGSKPALDQFCYPSGEYHSAAFDWLLEAGVRYALTCTPGLAGPKTRPMIIPRFIDSTSQPMAVFEAWASGFSEWLPRRSHATA
jgi:peptidoglycan/xylan/chitin deacetylase (PgdA/CDA1 family)